MILGNLIEYEFAIFMGLGMEGFGLAWDWVFIFIITYHAVLQINVRLSNRDPHHEKPCRVVRSPVIRSRITSREASLASWC